MKNIIRTAAVAAVFGLSACNVEKTEEGRAPDVDVNADAGELPEYDVDTPDVNVGTENVVVQVPDVDVSAPEDQQDTPANRQ